MEMTVRECIKEMRKIPSVPVPHIITLNGTIINIPDIKRKKSYASKIKLLPDGEPIFRIISCIIVPNKNTKGLDLIKQYSRHDQLGLGNNNIFRENEYYIPERELNRFISTNCGIDRFCSIIANWWMYKDHKEMIEDIIRKDG